MERLTSTEFTKELVSNKVPAYKRRTYRQESDLITEFLDRNGNVALKRIVNDCGYVEFWKIV